MKIAFISSLYGEAGGGAGIIAEHLARGLSNNGHQILAITTGQTVRPVLTMEDGVKVYRFKPRNLYPVTEKDLHPLWQKTIWQMIDIYNPHSARVLRQILKEESPDIVHIHKMRGLSGAAWWVASTLFPGRVVQTCHDYESMSPDGLLRGSIGDMALHGRWPVRGYQLLRKRFSRGVSYVTAPSQFTLQRIQQSGLFPSANTKVIANTHGWMQAELQSIRQASSLPMNKRFTFLFLGRLEPEKGILDLCEAFARAFELVPSLTLQVAGWGSLESVLRDKFAHCAGIQFLGRVSGQVKMDVLRSSDVVVVPSTVEEVFGITVIEAFALGRPVLASNLGGLPELIREGETGWIVEPGDRLTLTNALLRISRLDPAMKARMSENCRRISFQYSLETVIAQYEQIYRQLIK